MPDPTLHTLLTTVLDHEGRISKLEAQRTWVDLLGINDLTKKLAIALILVWMAQAGYKDTAAFLADVLRP